MWSSLLSSFDGWTLKGPGEKSLICDLRFGESERNVLTSCDVAEGTQASSGGLRDKGGKTEREESSRRGRGEPFSSAALPMKMQKETNTGKT